jgi:protein-tyrosine phosphatase
MFKKIAVVALASLITGVLPACADVTDLSCIQTAPAEYTLSFSLTGGSHEVQIFASTDAAGTKGLRPVLKTFHTQVTVHAGEPGKRMYFFLKPDHGEQREVSIRRLPLEGTPNFRDLGGYETSDGRFVQWGKIYRSGVLSYLTPADLTYLSQLGIHVVCDFRTQQENEAAPEKWVADADVDRISLPIGSDANGNTLASMQALLATNPTPAQLRAWMTKVYSDFAFRAAPEYSKVFIQLKEDHLPLLYHCAAGKDRTGVFSALLLLSLGVPEKTVLGDYTLSTKYIRQDTHSEASRKMMASSGTALSKLTPEQRDVLLSAGSEYLESTLRAIDSKYGSFDNYRREALGVSDNDVETLRARLLTK